MMSMSKSIHKKLKRIFNKCISWPSLLTVFLISVIINLFLFKGLLLSKQKLEEFEDVGGFFLSEIPSQNIIPWWWCAGRYQLYERMLENIMTVSLPPWKNHYEAYYARSCIKAAISLLHLPKDKISDMQVTRIEKWQDYATGIHGFVDLTILGQGGSPIQQNVTMEFDDDTSLPIKISLNTFNQTKNSKVWFVVTSYDRPAHFLRFLKSITNLYDSGEHNFGLCIGTFYSHAQVETFEEQEVKKLSDYHFDLQIVRAPLPFRKAPTLQKCIFSPQISPDDIVYMVDVDVGFDTHIIERMKRFVVKEKRAFSPIVWYRDEGNYENNPRGFAKGGTGLIALYKSDIMRFGGYDISTFQDQHGFEDTDFFYRIRSLKMQVVRSYERTMEHWPHTRDNWEKQGFRNVDLLCPSF